MLQNIYKIMNDGEATKYSLDELIQKMIPLLDLSSATERFAYTVENFESQIEDLEARVENIQQEIDLLIAQQ